MLEKIKLWTKWKKKLIKIELLIKIKQMKLNKCKNSLLTIDKKLTYFYCITKKKRMNYIMLNNIYKINHDNVRLSNIISEL